MKKTFFFLALLASVAASATVTVTPISTDYAAKQVTFKVVWTNSPSAPYNNRVWIWIDFCPVTGTQPAATFSPASITNPVKTGGNGSITGLNGRGFFIAHAATNAGTTVTATLSNAPAGKFNWCAYGSDYPPNVTLENGTYTFKGTTNFVVSSHAQPITSQTVARTSLTVNSQSTFTDATGYPGIGQLYCPYSGSDLIMDATHICQQRATGDKNWEAWIKDTRDSELYRIVLMPDNKWWLAQNVKYAGTGSSVTINGCTADKCGRYYTGEQANSSQGGTSGTGPNVQGICPSGWVLPVGNDFRNLVDAISPNTAVQLARLRAKQSTCADANDYYGWADDIVVDVPQLPSTMQSTYRANDNVHCAGGMFLSVVSGGTWYCNQIGIGQCITGRNAWQVTVRCFRQ